ncbi:MAG: thermonuclease family protein [Alphaproteobacteria bacterium]
MIRTIMLVAIVLATGPAAAETLAGRARVVDGDSLVVDGRRVRLFAIDAPELHEPLGERSRRETVGILGDRPVACAVRGYDGHARAIAVCRAGDVDIAGELVRRGWARAWRHYGRDYAALEAEARAAGRGMWAPGLEAARASPRHRE